MTAVRNELAAVRRRLQAYADRGVFRGYTERPARAGRHYFRFLWLGREPFNLTYEPASGMLTFTNVLPHVRVRSALYQALERFVEGRSARKLPAHRRIDPRRARPSCSSRRGTMLLHVAWRSRGITPTASRGRSTWCTRSSCISTRTSRSTCGSTMMSPRNSLEIVARGSDCRPTNPPGERATALRRTNAQR